MFDWIDAAEFASLVGMETPRCARKAFARALSGQTWRGCRIVIREVAGRGGRSGTHCEARVDSLPSHLYERWKASRRPDLGPLNGDAKAVAERDWRYHLISAAIPLPRHSVERGENIRAVAAQAHFHPVAGSVTVSERSLHRWLERYDLLGLGGLQDRARGDKGKSKVHVSAAWDRAVPFDDAVKAAIGASIKQELRDLWGNGGVFSVVRRLASDTLADVTRMRGADLDENTLAAICRLPKNLVESERASRRVHQYRTDRKGWNDSRSRVRRLPDGHRPMEIVMGDVHHIDILLQRPNGSSATPKMIAWMDVATHRIRFDLVLCEPGTGVRNADLINSFVKMVDDPEWGVPSSLYVDNGSEYGFADLAGDVMQLAGVSVFLSKPEGSVRRSTPYEGSSKGLLEGSFRILKDQCFAVMDGFIGGDRMKSKSANLGRPPEPFRGGFEAFSQAVTAAVAYHNTNERRGGLRNRTPDQVFRAFVEQGWQRIDADPDALMMAFSTQDMRTVRQGAISVSLPGDGRGSVTYVHDELPRYEGQKVRVHLPKFSRWPGIPVYRLDGTRIGVAMEPRTYGYSDEAGAVEAGRMKRRDRAIIHDEAKKVRPVDMVGRMARSAERRLGHQVPTSAGEVQLRSGAAEDARDMRADPGATALSANAEAQRRQIERVEFLKARRETIARNSA